MDHVVAFLNERGYLARWEKEEQQSQSYSLHETNTGGAGAGDISYLLHKCNCPYSSVETAQNELCTMDMALIEKLLGQKCERICSLTDDDPCCTYRIIVQQNEREPVATEALRAS